MEQSTGEHAATVIGALVGGSVIGILGCCPGVVAGEIYVETYDYSQGGHPFAFPFYVMGVSIGFLIGEVIGTWVALDAWDHSGALQTAGLLAMMLVLSTGGLVFMAIADSNLRLLLLVPVLFLILPVIARAIVAPLA